MTVKSATASRSVVGHTNAAKQYELLGMLHDPYVFMIRLFASLGCMMYGYDQGVMGSILVMQTSKHISLPSLAPPSKVGLSLLLNLVIDKG